MITPPSTRFDNTCEGLGGTQYRTSAKGGLLKVTLWTVLLSQIVNSWGPLGIWGTAMRVGSAFLGGAVGIFIMSTGHMDKRTAVAWLAAPFIVMLLSAFYSLAPVYGFVNAMCGTGIVLLCLGMSSHWRERFWEKVVSCSYPIGLVACVLSLGQFIFNPDWSLDEVAGERFRSVLGGSNAAGRFGAILAWITVCTLVCRPRQRNRYLMVAAGVCIALTVITYCKTVLIAFGLAAASAALVRFLTPAGLRVAVVTVGCVGILCVLLFAPATLAPNVLRYSEELDSALTGRGVIWHHAILAAAERPWWGYGVGSYGIAMGRQAGPSVRSRYLAGDVRSGIHSDYLKVILEVGLIGAAPYFLLLLRAAWVATRNLSEPMVLGVKHLQQFGVLIIALLCNVTGIGLSSAGLPWTVLAWFALVAVIVDSAAEGGRGQCTSVVERDVARRKARMVTTSRWHA